VRCQPFDIEVPDEVLDDLRRRIRSTRWPDPAPGEPWSQGVDSEYLRDLLAYWADGFDWRAQEERLNGYDHQVADIEIVDPDSGDVDVDGVRLHHVSHRSTDPGDGEQRLPLILLHGWPSSFLEMLPLVDRLGEKFDVVVPSLPGYAFSSRPPRTGVDRAYVAEVCHRLMDGLGYTRYGAYGADFGAGVATHLALAHPDRVVGIHLSTPEMTPYIGPGSPPLSADERAYLDRVAAWDSTERGYSSVQSTRPQTLGYALSDSPVGLAAWVLDKWRSWSDSRGDLDTTFGRDPLLRLLTVWWVTGCVTSSMRDYYDNRWHTTPLRPSDRVAVPTAMALFPNELVPEGVPPRSWYERLYPIRRWTVHSRGGHFAAAEQPDLLANDIAEFFTGLP
jgi:pimeloyl-ACP methyl ester carboxylesterase